MSDAFRDALKDKIDALSPKITAITEDLNALKSTREDIERAEALLRKISRVDKYYRVSIGKGFVEGIHSYDNPYPEVISVYRYIYWCGSGGDLTGKRPTISTRGEFGIYLCNSKQKNSPTEYTLTRLANCSNTDLVYGSQFIPDLIESVVNSSFKRRFDFTWSKKRALREADKFRKAKEDSAND